MASPNAYSRDDQLCRCDMMTNQCGACIRLPYANDGRGGLITRGSPVVTCFISGDECRCVVNNARENYNNVERGEQRP